MDSIYEQFLKACPAGDLDKVKKCFKRSSDLECGINYGAALALSEGHVHVAKYLVDEHGASLFVDSVKSTAEHGILDSVKYLVEECKLDIHDDYEYAMRWASLNDHVDIVKYLMSKGADHNAFKYVTDWSHAYDACEVIAAELRKENKFKRNLEMLKNNAKKTQPVRRRRSPKSGGL